MSLAELEQVQTSTEVESSGGLLREAVTRLRRSPVAIIGAVLITLFVLVALLAPVLAPHSPTAADLTKVRPGSVPGPSAAHWLGLDEQGRDELSRLIYGARWSLLIGIVSTTLGVTIGVILGTLAGGLAGWVDGVIMRLMDIMLAVPGLLFAIGLAALLGPSLKSVMIAIATVNVPIFARLLRASMLSQRVVAAALRKHRGPLARRSAQPDHPRPRAAQLTGAGDRAGDAGPGHGHHRRRRSRFPGVGLRRPLGAGVGKDAGGEPERAEYLAAVGHPARAGDHRLGARLHPARGGPARVPRPQAAPVSTPLGAPVAPGPAAAASTGSASTGSASTGSASTGSASTGSASTGSAPLLSVRDLSVRFTRRGHPDVQAVDGVSFDVLPGQSVG